MASLLFVSPTSGIAARPSTAVPATSSSLCVSASASVAARPSRGTRRLWFGASTDGASFVSRRQLRSIAELRSGLLPRQSSGPRMSLMQPTPDTTELENTVFDVDPRLVRIVEKTILTKRPVTLFSHSEDDMCFKAKELCEKLKITDAIYVVEIDEVPSGGDILRIVSDKSGGSEQLPNLFIGQQHVAAGWHKLAALNESGELAKLLAAAGISVAV